MLDKVDLLVLDLVHLLVHLLVKDQVLHLVLDLLQFQGEVILQ